MQRGQHEAIRGFSRSDAGRPALADCYAATLLHSLGVTPPAGALALPPAADVDAARDWAESGLMWLTGQPGAAPVRCAHAAPSCARGALRAFSLVSGIAPAALPDGAALLSERAAIAGFTRRGRRSPNGSCALYRTADGWIALNLPRADDRALLPAWLEAAGDIDGEATLRERLAGRNCAPLLARARLLGLPAAALPAAQPAAAPPWFRCTAGAPSRAPVGTAAPLVVDLSALWAGPLCADLLRRAGARVIKVESSARPDGARGGARPFYDLLNAGKECVQVDFRDPADRRRLRRLLARADIVIESSRPRALRQLGIDAHTLLAARPGMVWLSITGYGRREPRGHWVAFGDDAGAAAGLCHPGSAEEPAPAFCGDAICDPLAGLHAAVAATALRQRGRGGLLDVNLFEVGAWCRAFYRSRQPGSLAQGAGGAWTLDVGGRRFPVRRPAARAAVESAAAPGAHSTRVFREMGIPC